MLSRLLGLICSVIAFAFIAAVLAATGSSAIAGAVSWTFLGVAAVVGAAVGAVSSLLFPEPVNFYATWLVRAIFPG